MSSLVECLPPMLTGDDLEKAMAVYPEYDESIREQHVGVRLMELSSLYDIYIPNLVSKEVYSKIYISLVQSLKKKETKTAVKQVYENHRIIKGQDYTGIMGGTTSLTIIGKSGLGKSSTISRVISLVGGNNIIESEELGSQIIPILVVQTPFDSSVKNLLLEILRQVDSHLGSEYYANAIRFHATTDILIGSTSQVCLNHVGMICIDEIQNVVNSKNGVQLVACLTQLLNTAGINVCMIGTPESMNFFTKAYQLARRTLGLQYEEMEYGPEFYNVCKTLFSYQYVKNKTYINDGIVRYLYERSMGNISIVAFLIKEAQEISILDGREILNIDTLSDAYMKRMAMLHDYITPPKKRQSTVKQKTKLLIDDGADLRDDFSIVETVQYAKKRGENAIELLQQYISIERVNV